jgi:competence protein ComEC
MTGIAAGSAALLGTALGWWGAVIMALLSILALTFRSSRVPWFVCAVAVVAGLLGAWRGETYLPAAVTAHVIQDERSAIVVTAPVLTGQRQHFAVEPNLDEALTPTGPRARVCVTAGAVPTVHLGDELQLEGTKENVVDQSMRNRAAVSARGCIASLFATSVRITNSSPSVQRALADLRTRLGAVLRQSAPGDAGVLLAGLVTGEDDGFSLKRKDAFIRTGTTHLTAVSGSNLALVATILATIGAATIGRHRASWQFATILGIWGYALVSGTHAPSLRAAIVATMAVVAFRVGRRPDFVTLILLAAGAMAVVEPRQIESLGFRLSVAASLALVLVLTGMMAKDRISRLAVVLTATVAAQLATLPVLLPIFGTVSLTSVPANIIAVPLAAVAMPLAALAAIAGLIWQPLGEVIAAPATLVATALISSVDALAAPGTYISVGVPPLPAAAAIAVAAVGVLTVIAGQETLWGASPAQGHSKLVLTPMLSAPLLPSPPAGVLAGEDPLDAFAAHLDEAKKHPTGKEVRHEFAEVGQTTQTIAGEVARHLPDAHLRGEP